MINIELMDKEDFRQCSSCLKSIEETDIYKIEIGKTMRQTTTLKLCSECLKELGNKINRIGERCNEE